MVGSCRGLKENLDELRIERVCRSRVTLVLFRTRRRDDCSRLKEGVGVAFEKAVRRKPLADAGVMQIEWSEEGCRSSRESSRPLE